MTYNLIGLAAGMAAFLGIWLGHVSVREIERRTTSLIIPALCFALVGVLFEIGALLSHSTIISGVLGILGTTLLWDALEFPRQQNRIIKGHAPANPSNPRHARLLAEYKTATTLDALEREPAGRPISPQESVRLTEEKEGGE
jgi:4-amino-4-deoxy-L-arabinose transferase-like glycosyltransferase